MTKPSKSSVETVKTVLIAVLVTGIVAFVAGMQFANRNNAQVNAKLEAVASKNQ